MDYDLSQLNILANNIITIGSAILTEAAILEAEANAAEPNESNSDDISEIQLKATSLNILGCLVVLIGDSFSAVLAEAEVNQNIEEGQQPSEADKLDILGSWISVIGDYLSYLAAVKVSQEK